MLKMVKCACMYKIGVIGYMYVPWHVLSIVHSFDLMICACMLNLNLILYV